MPSIRQMFQWLLLRLRRQRLVVRNIRKGAELTVQVPPPEAKGILLFAVVRNEHHRLPEFLAHYRELGVSQFYFVDNGSGDETNAYLRNQPDVALWYTGASYRRARYGMDWLDSLKRRHGCDRWCLTVDADELLVYPGCSTRPLPALTDWLDDHGCRSFSTMLLDLYSGPDKAGVGITAEGSLGLAPWFDSGNYRSQPDPVYRNDWIQGGPRERAFFSSNPTRAPALNKVPLVRWQKEFTYVSSTHSVLPRGLNKRREIAPTGVLLHTKFLPDFAVRAAKEVQRREHFDGGFEYRAYLSQALGSHGLHHAGSMKLSGWRQLEALGLMSRGIWV